MGELAAFISSRLRKHDIDVVLSGGGCVSIYSDNRYVSWDLDFIDNRATKPRKLKDALAEIGFYEENRYFKHPDTQIIVEFPSGPLAIGAEPVKEPVIREFTTGKLKLLSPTDCVKDRLAAYYHWKDRQCLEQAILVAKAQDVDLGEIERWSKREAKGSEFRQIKKLLIKA